ncbi:hypothetical protein DNH61_06100 [Paenibacillus sambharensis]|uniref:Pyruvate, phosphate dikinase n=1 Tax=Paenibacillus sambharensis TaxID=1803190 RepID=A0A2W1LC95_9BACL|nr:putative PEP-binding protein [Paenibacillus sambharensis]PZD96766.1 hypothetical protein DNH61_06100 [Paenibacillus sambharensis]
MLKLNEKTPFLTELDQLARRTKSPEDVLMHMKEEDLTNLLSASFVHVDQEKAVGTGESILPGDVSGQLVLDRDLGELLLAEADRRGTSVPIIYSRENGNLEDFHVLKASRGFFTSQKGRTTFCPVQASCEGVPTLIAVGCEYRRSDVLQPRTFRFEDGSELTVERPMHSLVFPGAELQEGDRVSMSGSSGLIFKGELEARPSDIFSLYDLLAECYLESLDTHGPAAAKHQLTSTAIYQNNRGFLTTVASSHEFQGFQLLKNKAREIAALKVFSTAHAAKTMALTKLFASDIAVVDGHIHIDFKESEYGLGLLRDERMWNQADDIDLMRIVFLGEGVIGPGYAGYKDSYLARFTDMVYDVFKVGTGAVAVVRLLCMPYNMIFHKTFDSAKFSAKYGLNDKAVADRVQVLAGESETYHGCRGVRVTVQREDICELWCEGVIQAAMRAYNEGVPVQVQVLLSMVTFPQEVDMFITTFEKVVARYDAQAVARGISVMIETSGSYHLAEDILDLSGDRVQVSGVLFGGNDFTAACLNMNRADSAASIIPEYIKLNIMSASPFQHLNEQIVGKAIVQTLKRTVILQRGNKRDYLMGLGGEVAGSWESVQWLSRHAAPHGLHYVSTPPDRMFFSLMASAQAALHTVYC